MSTNFHRDVDSPDQKVSLMVMQFGQFLDHDITLTPEAELDQGVDCCEVTEDSLEKNSGVCLGIPLPPGDKFAEDNDLTCLEFRFVDQWDKKCFFANCGNLVSTGGPQPSAKTPAKSGSR